MAPSEEGASLAGCRGDAMFWMDWEEALDAERAKCCAEGSAAFVLLGGVGANCRCRRCKDNFHWLLNYIQDVCSASAPCHCCWPGSGSVAACPWQTEADHSVRPCSTMPATSSRP